jgi:hypothetical protein
MHAARCTHDALCGNAGAWGCVLAFCPAVRFRCCQVFVAKIQFNNYNNEFNNSVITKKEALIGAFRAGVLTLDSITEPAQSGA